MPLVWQTSKPAPDPFEATVGDRTTYQVHFAESEALDLPELEAAIGEVTKKALDFAEANKGERSKRILFLWDVVYATLTVVYTDDSMMHDARNVTKCYFAELDKEGTAGKLRGDIRRMIESGCGNFPVTVPVYYSDEDRASVGAKNFRAQQLTSGSS